MDALVEGPAGQELPVGAEGHAVHGLRVLGQRVEAHPPLHLPEPHRRVKRRAARSVTPALARSWQYPYTAKCLLPRQSSKHKMGLERYQKNIARIPPVPTKFLFFNCWHLASLPAKLRRRLMRQLKDERQGFLHQPPTEKMFHNLQNDARVDFSQDTSDLTYGCRVIPSSLFYFLSRFFHFDHATSTL